MNVVIADNGQMALAKLAAEKSVELTGVKDAEVLLFDLA